MSGVRAVRISLIAIGVLGLIGGAAVLLLKQTPEQIVGLGVWVLGAIILHDALLSPLVVGAGMLARRAGRRAPYAILAIVQTGVIVAGILALIVVPEIYAKTLGVANPTVLPWDYSVNLLLCWGGVAVATVAACVVYSVTRRAGVRREEA